MRKVVLASCVLLLAVGFTVAAQDTFDSLVGEMVKHLNKTADVLQTITDKASAEGSMTKLKEVAAAMQNLKTRVDKLGKPNADEAKVLEKKYKPEIQKASKRIVAEGLRLAKIEGVAGVLKEIDLFGKKTKKDNK